MAYLHDINNAVWALPNLSTSELVVLLSLAKHANGAGECWPKLTTICNLTRLAERAVRNALRTLEKLKHLVTTRMPNGRNHYQLKLGCFSRPKPPAPPAPPPAPDAGATGTSCRSPIVENSFRKSTKNWGSAPRFSPSLFSLDARTAKPRPTPTMEPLKMTPPLYEKIKAIHAVWNECTGQELRLIPGCYEQEFGYHEFIQNGFTADDIRLVVGYLKRKIRAEKRLEGSLRWSNCIGNLQRFNEDLAAASLEKKRAQQRPLVHEGRAMYERVIGNGSPSLEKNTAKPVRDYIAELRSAVSGTPHQTP